MERGEGTKAKGEERRSDEGGREDTEEKRRARGEELGGEDAGEKRIGLYDIIVSGSCDSRPSCGILSGRFGYISITIKASGILSSTLLAASFR